MDKNIMHLNDGLDRLVNRNEFEKVIDEYKYNMINDGISTIKDLNYQENPQNNFINVFNFTTPYLENQEGNFLFNLKNGRIPFTSRRLSTMKLYF